MGCAMALWCEQAWLAEGWRNDVRLSLDNGRISSIEIGVDAAPGDERHAILLPALPNLHSHAFQRGMAGLAERAGASDDSFWTWREVMYRFVDRLDPDATQALAALLTHPHALTGRVVALVAPQIIVSILLVPLFLRLTGKFDNFRLKRR